MNRAVHRIEVRNTRSDDFDQIIEMTQEVYPGALPWGEDQLSSHLRVFPEGQFVAVEQGTGRIMGMAASLVVLWDDYEMHANWRDFTAGGMFTNHDPESGRTLYGAEVMVRPEAQRRGIGKKLYAARRELAVALGLRRIRAGARLRSYHRHARRISAEEYVIRVIRGSLRDATLSFQLREGFHVIEVVAGYLKNDPQSLGYAAVIEWRNQAAARPEDHFQLVARFEPPPESPKGV